MSKVSPLDLWMVITWMELVELASRRLKVSAKEIKASSERSPVVSNWRAAVSSCSRRCSENESSSRFPSWVR